MIPKDFITEWRREAPWAADEQVEQDLILSRAVVEMFQDSDVSRALALRGGTALYKLHIRPPLRYSEDIDLVQVNPEPIGPTLDAIRSKLDPWLGEPRRTLKEGRVILGYRMTAEEPQVPMRLKIEINSREHFTAYGYEEQTFKVESRWFSGEAEVRTFPLDELLATKFRALYQRRKGRDLFDLWVALDRGLVSPERVVAAFERYMAHGDTGVTRAQFEANLAAKLKNPRFLEDLAPLLAPGSGWDPDAAQQTVAESLVCRLKGDPWKGTGD